MDKNNNLYQNTNLLEIYNENKDAIDIINDEDTLFVLSFLFYIGQITIKNLLNELETSHEDLQTSLNKLLKLKFIKNVENNNITVTERGENFLKALELKEEITSVDILKERGETLYSLKRYEDAIVAFEQAIKIKPNDFEAWNNKGVALYYLKRYVDAIVGFEHAINIEPNYYVPWCNKGGALDNLERYTESVNAYVHGLNIKPVPRDNYNSRLSKAKILLLP